MGEREIAGRGASEFQTESGGSDGSSSTKRKPQLWRSCWSKCSTTTALSIAGILFLLSAYRLAARHTFFDKVCFAACTLFLAKTIVAIIYFNVLWLVPGPRFFLLYFLLNWATALLYYLYEVRLAVFFSDEKAARISSTPSTGFCRSAQRSGSGTGGGRARVNIFSIVLYSDVTKFVFVFAIEVYKAYTSFDPTNQSGVLPVANNAFQHFIDALKIAIMVANLLLPSGIAKIVRSVGSRSQRFQGNHLVVVHLGLPREPARRIRPRRPTRAPRTLRKRRQSHPALQPLRNPHLGSLPNDPPRPARNRQENSSNTSPPTATRPRPQRRRRPRPSSRPRSPPSSQASTPPTTTTGTSPPTLPPPPPHRATPPHQHPAATPHHLQQQQTPSFFSTPQQQLHQQHQPFFLAPLRRRRGPRHRPRPRPPDSSRLAATPASTPASPQFYGRQHPAAAAAARVLQRVPRRRRARQRPAAARPGSWLSEAEAGGGGNAYAQQQPAWNEGGALGNYYNNNNKNKQQQQQQQQQPQQQQQQQQ
ncbi:hypothetical protein DFJ73DRAFT_770039 [Zopfochytrium polystomum]|nr:hypothetical protein DFJ73DRAFT_770039 [Zopfochytrium polystomum]